MSKEVRKIYERSSNYRAIYLKYNKGIFHKWYLCPYCRKKFLQKDIVEVDHLIAVNLVKTSPMFRLLFSILGKDVNDILNLVGACRPCNRAKSCKGGSWIIRGANGAVIHRLLQDISIAIEDFLKTFWYVFIILIAIGIFTIIYTFWRVG